jgi:hypothetical protein
MTGFPSCFVSALLNPTTPAPPPYCTIPASISTNHPAIKRSVPRNIDSANTLNIINETVVLSVESLIEIPW